jgi:ABC-type oligopeptide transport system ATPase subunit
MMPASTAAIPATSGERSENAGSAMWGLMAPRLLAQKPPGKATHRRVEGAAAREKVFEMLRSVGLEPSMADRFPHELSGGQRQRMAIARALITSPRLVVFDEVVSALDVSIQAQILNLIRQLQAERGFAALFISHDLGVVRYVANRVAVIYAGEMMERLPAATLYSDASSHPYTRALQAASLGAPSRFQLRDSLDLPEHGCPLAPRCSLAVARCGQVHPPVREMGGLQVACHRAEEVISSGAHPLTAAR